MEVSLTETWGQYHEREFRNALPLNIIKDVSPHIRDFL